MRLVIWGSFEHKLIITSLVSIKHFGFPRNNNSGVHTTSVLECLVLTILSLTMSLLDSSYGAKLLFRTKQVTVVDIQPHVTHGGLLPFFLIHEAGISYLSCKEVIVSSRRLNAALFHLLLSKYEAHILPCKVAKF